MSFQRKGAKDAKKNMRELNLSTLPFRVFILGFLCASASLRQKFLESYL